MVKNIMKMKKTRNTPQRTVILDNLKQRCDHPTAEMIYKDVVTGMPTITLATVYRNLNILADQDQILKLEINNEFHFDGDIKFHQHGICKTCGEVVDIFQEEISKYALKKLNKEEFSANNVNVLFYGICKNCI